MLMGHSTGCQDVMEYLTGEGKDEREKVDGGILQAGISDREAITSIGMDEELEETIFKVQDLLKSGQDTDDILSLSLTKPFFSSTPLTASRFLSLTTPHGADDYFSTDLIDEDLQKSFGAIEKGTGLLVLFSGDDEYVGEDADREGLVERWLGFARRAGVMVDEGCGVLEGATHSLEESEEEVVRELCGRVKAFLKRL